MELRESWNWLDYRKAEGLSNMRVERYARLLKKIDWG